MVNHHKQTDGTQERTAEAGGEWVDISVRGGTAARIAEREEGEVSKMRPAMICGLETLALKKREEVELEVAQLKMLSYL